MPSFFSWQVETVLFFLAEEEKNGFKKAFLLGDGGWARQIQIVEFAHLHGEEVLW